MNSKFVTSFCIGLLVTIAAGVADQEEHFVKPSKGLVPDAETAIKIAVAVWTPIYGEANIERQKPFHACLKKEIWHVSGSLPKGWVGGVAMAEISREDARILRVSHGR